MGNYNLKNILLGIGIGLILSSVINISMSSNEMTVEEIKKEAEKHGLIVLTKEEIMNNQTPVDVPDPTPSAMPETTAGAEPEISPAPTSTPVVPEGKAIVNVKSGMSSEDIANLLNEAGVIKDTKAFLKRLGELGFENRLKVGSFEITKGLGYDDIIKILTR